MSAAKVSVMNRAVQGKANEGIRERLIKFLAENDQWTPKSMSEDMQSRFQRGCARSTLSMYIDGNYTVADFKPLEDRIVAWLDFREGKQKRITNFIETRAAAIVARACRESAKEAVINVVIGDPGLGKTEGLTEWTNKTNLKIALVTGYDGMTPKGMLSTLASALRCQVKGHKHTLLAAIGDALRNGYRLLIFDEGDFLCEQSLNHLRYLHDTTNVGLVLCGTDQLNQLFDHPTTVIGRARLKSRVAATYKLPKLSSKEIASIAVDTYGIEVTPSVIDSLARICKGSFRELTHTFRTIDKLRAGKSDATLQQIVDMASTRFFADTEES